MPGAPPWSKEEVAIVVSFFPKRMRRQYVDWAKLLPLLNGRTRTSVLNHMRKLRLRGVVKGSLGSLEWTKSELKKLRAMWQFDAPRTIMQKLRGRNWAAIMLKARDLGLGTAIPQGYLSTCGMAAHLGVDYTVVRKIAEFSAIRPRIHYGCKVPRSRLNAIRWVYWPTDDMEDACRKWLEYEATGPLLTSVAHDLRRTPEWVLAALKALNIEVDKPEYFRISPDLKARLKEYKKTCP